MKVLGYIRVSTERQDINNQRMEILEYGRKHDLKIENFIEIEISSRKDKKQRRIEELLEKLSAGDILIVSELSRLGRSTAEVIDIVNELVRLGISLVAIKQNLQVKDGKKMDMQTKVIVTMFSLFAELERDIISERTRQSLQAKKAGGKKLGKPKGTIQASRLDEKQDAIREFLKHRVPKSAIARMLRTSRTNLVNYIKTRSLEKKDRSYEQ
ncbi:MAG: recombinase family protein [Thermodesulfovibrionales bacterium]|jgi:DNA invertase Pin-like site-specific DNA recombinase